MRDEGHKIKKKPPETGGSIADGGDDGPKGKEDPEPGADA